MIAVHKVKVITFGCQMNVYDSRRIVEALAQIGYAETDCDEEADLFVVNTCSVREKPAQKVFSTLGRLREHKLRNPGVLLAVAGCVAQQEQDALARRVPYVDLVLGPDQVADVAQHVEQARRTGRQVIAAGFREDREGLFPKPATPLRPMTTAFVTVMKGCNQYCSYCIVPYVRGREFSKPPEDVIREVSLLAEHGVREVTLLGQNVNRYGMGTPGFPRFSELLAMVAEVPGISRLRFTTSHPADFGPDLVAAFATIGKLCPYLHLPLQSGSDRILTAMNRRYAYRQYMTLVAALRDACPGINVSTDLIVGFPGETDADFQATLDAAHELRWGAAFSFKYSPRPGTAAAAMPDDVPSEVKQERLARVQELLFQTQTEAMQKLAGTEQEVLVEGSGPGRNTPDARQWTGRTRTNYVVNMPAQDDGPDLAGRTVTVRIARVLPHSLLGELPASGKAVEGGGRCRSK